MRCGVELLREWERRGLVIHVAGRANVVNKPAEPEDWREQTGTAAVVAAS